MKLLLDRHELASQNLAKKLLEKTEYLTTDRNSVANFQVRNRSQNYTIFNVRTIVQPLKYLQYLK